MYIPQVDLRCQHKTYSPSPKKTKNTNCPATMFLILKRFMCERKSRWHKNETRNTIQLNRKFEHPNHANYFETLHWNIILHLSFHRSGDPHIEEGYFLHVNLRNEHNHRLNTAEFMRRRDVSNDTIEKLQQLYKCGHSPSSALKNIKYNLQEEEGENFTYAIADRSICPDLQFCYR